MSKRSRPKTYKYDTFNHPNLWRHWRRWLPSMSADITDLFSKKEIFWDLQEVAKENNKLLNKGIFFDWMCRNYVISQTVGIRSFVDQSRGSHSLWRMLYEILEHPGVISRAAHVEMYRDSPMGEELGHMSFNSVVGKSAKRLGQNAIRADMRRLEDACERIRRFVNKRIAHRTHATEIRRLPIFDELDEALRVIDEIFCKYNLLLRAQGLSTCEAVHQEDWREVLWEPWIARGSKLRPQ